MENWITVDSFGSECPSNWEEIADFLNEIIRDKRETVDEELAEIEAHQYDPGVSLTESYERTRDIEYSFESWCDDLWETFCRGELEGAPEPKF